MKNILLLLIVCLLLSSVEVQAGMRKKKKNATKEVKVSTEYDKLFRENKCQTEKGMITLHKMDGRVYFEFPVKLFDREMLLGSTIEEISDNGEAIVGQKPHDPLHIVFTKIDTNVLLRFASRVSVTRNEDKNIQRALDQSNIGAIVKMFPVKCWNNTKDAVVFDVTDFFVSDRSDMDPFDPYGANTFGGWIQRVSSYNWDASFIGDIRAYEDNISITSHLSFFVSLNALGMFRVQTDKPFTAEVKRSLILLPEQPMRPRVRDSRIGVFCTGKLKYTNVDNGSDVVYYAHRWRLEPKDPEAFKRGELVEVVNPVLFYIDNNFPAGWVKYIRQGVEDWNLAFERIGFKNAVQTHPFPLDDPDFDPNNMKYNCIRYAPIPIENAMGPSWVDPRSGEILNASVYLYHNMVSLLYTWRMIQTAAVDPKVRCATLPDELMGEAIRYVSRHEVGHCFGLMHNMAASHAYPTDSLRSASFTQKYGTTPSIMDYARFNYVAQPGDLEQGVKLSPPVLGEYDYYAIHWLYKPILEVSTSEKEVPVLNRWISEKAGDPIYRYGKQQVFSRYDPSALEEDLGDDAVKSAGYGMKNLQYVLAHFSDWVNEEDVDYDFRNKTYYAILDQFRRYVGHVSSLIGGIYLNERYAGDPEPTYRVVAKAEQKRALKFLLELQKDLSWLDNKELFKNISIIGSPAAFSQEFIMSQLLYKVKMLALANDKSKDPYASSEYLKDITDFVFKPLIQSVSLNGNERKQQLVLVNLLIKNAGTEEIQGKKALWGITDSHSEPDFGQIVDLAMYKFFHRVEMENRPEKESANPVRAVGFQRTIRCEYPNISHVYYDALLKIKRKLEQAKNRGDKETRYHYAFLLHRINKAIY